MTPSTANPDDLSMRRSQASNIWENLPSRSSEVIDGRLIAGNSLMGSRYLLWAILQLLGPRAALALAPLDQWWSALATAFQAPPLLASPRRGSAGPQALRTHRRSLLPDHTSPGNITIHTAS